MDFWGELPEDIADTSAKPGLKRAKSNGGARKIK
jgi:hypothetical protein